MKVGIRSRTRVAVVVAMTLVIAACGGTAETTTTEGSSLSRTGFPDDCPTIADSFNLMNETAYQVFGQIDFVDQNTGQPATHHMFIGTAWAVGERLLATNAHVAEVFSDTAEQGVQMSRAIAVQSGTGEVIRLLRGLVHPDYTGDPLRSPDVALFTSQDEFVTHLDLAPEDSVLDLGNEFQLAGFPGDVDNFIEVTPGETVPQATSLTGTISARRSHDDTQEVTLETLDVYQHQAPTTPGTSGSAMMHCGLVVGINNAGTVNMIVVPNADGELSVDRQAAASNNFGVHVRHIHEIVELFEANAVQGVELPVQATVQQPQAGGDGGVVGGGGTGGGGEGGNEGGGEGEGGETPQTNTLIAVGQTTGGGDGHEFFIEINLTDGSINGYSVWGSAEYLLAGSLNLETGEFSLTDDAPEQDPNLPRGYYFGYFYEDGTFEGYYAEDETTQIPIAGSITG